MMMIFLMISSFLSSCLEKATEALCIGQIQTRLELPSFQVFRLNFAFDFINLLLVNIPPNRDNSGEASYPMTQQRRFEGS